MRDEREFWNSEEIKHVQALVRQYEQAPPRRTAVERLVRDVHKDAAASKIPARWINSVPQSAKTAYHAHFLHRGLGSALGWDESSFPGLTISAGAGVFGGLLGMYVSISDAYNAIDPGGNGHFLLFGAALVDLPQMMIAVGGMGAVAFGGLSTAAWLPWKRVAMRRLKAVRKLESQALRGWLQARYGVQVEDDQLAVLADVVLNHSHSNSATEPISEKFCTSSGKELEFTTEDNDGVGWTVREPRQLPTAQKQLAISRTDSKDLGLSGELAVLHEAITMRLDNLGAQDLTVEQAHMLARAREDLSNTASLVRKMLSLEPLTQAQEAKVTGVLASLMEEVRGIQEQLQADIDRDLDVQAEYIRSRAVISGNRRLELSKAAPEAASANQEEEVDA